ncbi:MAG: DNA polymerase III subunit delta [Rhodospirillaceae bacterium]|nr:DNA polymerase III subunit delta [Rhodospirillaceae bacterium]
MKRDRAADIEAFLKAPDPAFRLVLFHGSDRGLVRERADRVARTVVPDPADPFRIVRITGAGIAEDPARLADEAAAIAMGGGRRVIRITEISDRHAKALAGFLGDPMGDALLVAEADALPASSSLRKAVEAAKNAVAIPCYPDEEWALEKVVAESLGQHGLAADEAAMAFLVDHLGGDRLLSRRELEKLALYAAEPGRDRSRPVTVEEAAASVGDTAGLTYDDLCTAVAGGDRIMADRCLTRLEAEGEAPVAILRIVSRHFQRLHNFNASVSAGRAPMDAAKSMRIFGPRANSFMAAARAWQGAPLVEAFRRLNEAEARCKSTGFPDWTVTARTLSALAGLPQRGTRRG